MRAAERDPAFDALLAKIAQDRGFGCDAYKPGCLRRRIAVRMRARGVHTYEQYVRLLDADGGEYDRLLDALTINVTKFFRNRETWDVLAGRVVPALWAERPEGLRGWSAGCASGEEPYTLAIVLREHAARLNAPVPPGSLIDATDYDAGSLARAEAASYGAAAFDEMPPGLRERYFTGGPPWRVTPDVRRLVQFRRHDLLGEPPPAPPYDLILCRNVVIYFDRRTQERLYAQFWEALRPGGRLVLGKVETLLGELRRQFELEDARERVYRRP